MQIESYPAHLQIKAPEMATELPENANSPEQSIVENAPPPLTPSSEVTLGEIDAASPVVTFNPEPQTDVATLEANTSIGSGKLPAKLASTLYVLNHSFDMQKQMLDVLI